MLGLVALMWLLEVVDVLTRHAFDAFGILPRTVAGLTGVVVAPFLHYGFGHLAANTIPFVVLGLLIAAAGAARFVVVTVVAALFSGMGVWLLAPSASITAGASGVVFGYAAYLIVRGFMSRRATQLAVTVVVIAVFGTGLLAGLVPRDGLSWQGHLFGAAGGVAAAFLLHRDRTGGAGR